MIFLAYFSPTFQRRISNHKINQAHIEFLKGMNYANFGETIGGVKAREKKYHARQELQEAMESIRMLNQLTFIVLTLFWLDVI